jgi:hypothetical protein
VPASKHHGAAVIAIAYALTDMTNSDDDRRRRAVGVRGPLQG